VLTARFADMGFSIRELMALVGAHSAGKQRFVDLIQANKSFDTTVDIWDTRFCKDIPISIVRKASRLTQSRFRHRDSEPYPFAWYVIPTSSIQARLDNY
jgi:hypothetical protein